MAFLCESDERKQVYLAVRFPHLTIFENCADLGRVHARTALNNCVRVPQAGARRHLMKPATLTLSCPGPSSLQVDVLVAGFPCKSVSMLTTTPGSVTDKGCTSGNGFLSVEAYCSRHRPGVVIMENVGSLFSKRKVEGGESSPFDWIVSRWACLSLNWLKVACVEISFAEVLYHFGAHEPARLHGLWRGAKHLKLWPSPTTTSGLVDLSSPGPVLRGECGQDFRGHGAISLSYDATCSLHVP